MLSFEYLYSDANVIYIALQEKKDIEGTPPLTFKILIECPDPIEFRHDMYMCELHVPCNSQI